MRAGAPLVIVVAAASDCAKSRDSVVAPRLGLTQNRHRKEDEPTRHDNVEAIYRVSPKLSILPIRWRLLTRNHSGLAWHTEEGTLRQKFEEFGAVEEAVCCGSVTCLSISPAFPFMRLAPAILCNESLTRGLRVTPNRLSSRTVILAGAVDSGSSATATMTMPRRPSRL